MSKAYFKKHTKMWFPAYAGDPLFFDDRMSQAGDVEIMASMFWPHIISLFLKKN